MAIRHVCNQHQNPSTNFVLWIEQPEHRWEFVGSGMKYTLFMVLVHMHHDFCVPFKRLQLEVSKELWGKYGIYMKHSCNRIIHSFVSNLPFETFFGYFHLLLLIFIWKVRSEGWSYMGFLKSRFFLWIRSIYRYTISGRGHKKNISLGMIRT